MSKQCRRLSQCGIFHLTPANKKRNISGLSGLRHWPFDTLFAAETLVKEAGNPCTEVQVFHRQYRENEAKTGAKVVYQVTFLFSCVYEAFIVEGAVLGGKFRAQNVT